MNAGARVVFQMGRQGFFHEATGGTHTTNETPHVAITIYAILEFAIPTIIIRSRAWPSPTRSTMPERSARSDSSAPTSSSRSRPRCTSRRSGNCKPLDIVLSAAALVCLLVPAVGSVYPVPAPPVNAFPYIFAAYFTLGLVVFTVRTKAGKEPNAIHHLTAEEALAS